ncbi:hypothetical protein JN12_00134 [Geobacter argillaceus]|uniref:Uncharacterized protein n=1 Tax=Geobacter argillaceus TaxID=345631 RepID=A0A562WST2_9BACT|nr:hypothetical protein JN12_00134 [Geobacter argillaceus]
MNYVIIGLVIVIISIWIIKYSSILGAIMLIIGLSIMMKGKKNMDNK